MKLDSTMTRLRAANPVPRPERIDDADLFARITATAPMTRAPRRIALPRRPRMVAALALLALVVLGSTAFAISNLFHGAVVEPPVTRAEYKAAQAQLTLPPGYDWPKLDVPSNSVTTQGGGGGHAVLIAQNAWECFWVQAIHDGDRGAQIHAQGMLDKLLADNIIEAPQGAPEDYVPTHPPAGPYAVFAHDGGLAWIKQGYRMAAAGHPARLQASCRANRP